MYSAKSRLRNGSGRDSRYAALCPRERRPPHDRLHLPVCAGDALHKHLVDTGGIGQPYHIRTCRLQDWGDRNIGWRNLKMAGSGELGDMLSHRLDYAHFLIGDMKRITADTRRFIDDRHGLESDLEDWVTVKAEFENTATGVLESSKLATGRGEGARSQDYCEINGSDASMVFQLENPNRFQIARKGQAGLETIDVPNKYLTWPGSTRDPRRGDPGIAFRWDQDFEFIDAIRNQRECEPSFRARVCRPLWISPQGRRREGVVRYRLPRGLT